MARSALATRSVPVIKLLLVEDGMSDAFLVESLLDEIGGTRYEVAHVRTEEEALEALAVAFDVCLLDLKLPGTSGFSALIDIQQKAPSMPVLMLTGVNDTALAKQAVGRGAQDYLQKDDLDKNLLARAIDHAIERKRMEKILFMRANHDSLTGLANRSMFESRMETALARAQRAGSAVAVLYIDLDHFKEINDSHGHEAGDEILKTVAERMKAGLRSYDTPARLGGDEFAVLLEDIAVPRDAAITAQKLIDTIMQPVIYHRKHLVVQASIGIAFSGRGSKSEPLIQQADTAMYHAKKTQGNHYCFFEPTLHASTHSHMQLEGMIEAALDAGEFSLFYQPYLRPGGDAIIGVEALLRWEHPLRGKLLPKDFLPAAEAGKLMPQISYWTALQLRHDINMWNHHNLPPLEIALNLSASQLDDPELAKWLAPLAHQELLEEHRLAIEISELDAAALGAAPLRTLGLLAAMGIALHLDHFGSGALSLPMLHSLPFSLLKMDMSLIRGMQNQKTGDAVVRAAIQLAHHLGIKAGAACVETKQQMQTLRARKCDAIQGYLTAPPMSAAAFTQWMKNPHSLAWN